MHAYDVLKSIGRTQPTTLLDIGARNFETARLFAKNGYQVHAIDPAPIEPPTHSDGVTFEQTTLETFDTTNTFGVVIASYISHLVKYDTYQFLERLGHLSKPDGLIYVTLLGDQDGWAENDWAKAAELCKTRAMIDAADLQIHYQSVEWFDGQLYDGTPKFWHLYKFVLGKEA